MAQSYSDAPPAYAQAVSSSNNNPQASTSSYRPDRLQPVARNGIPPDVRRSMEDQARPLPHGWVRRYDEKSSHQFFVDTNAKPPRSIWHHPYDDDQYLSTLSTEERERIQEEYRQPHLADIAAEDTDDEDHHHHDDGKQGHAQPAVGVAAATAGAAAHSTTDKGKKKETFGQKMKDKLTGSTHEERAAERRRREEEERAAYQRHLKIREAMNRAAQTGQPQLIGKDKNGKDLYIEPPPQPGYGYGMQPNNPYAQGPYGNPNATYLRPSYPYARPYGPGYGGGYGYGYRPGYGGSGIGLGGGLLGGLLLGGLLF